MSLRITIVVDDTDRDDLHIVFDQTRGTAQAIETSRLGTVRADRERPLSEVVDFLRGALTEARARACQ